MAEALEPQERAPRAPSLADALAPVVVLIGLLTLTIVLFGTAAADGPLQVALFTSAVFAGLVALKNGYTAASLRDAAIGGVSGYAFTGFRIERVVAPEPLAADTENGAPPALLTSGGDPHVE